MIDIYLLSHNGFILAAANSCDVTSSHSFGQLNCSDTTSKNSVNESFRTIKETYPPLAPIISTRDPGLSFPASLNDWKDVM